MNTDCAIQALHISKTFQLRHPKLDALGKMKNEFEALKDISFEIKKGESLGIIGSNGSGKSTLLKILAGVIKPSSGQVKISGKIASILDIGAGFHPELSGKENVFLNGQIHGFSKKEIKTKFDNIVAFAAIEGFMDEPVKNYSNGMYLRLAFSIMAHLDFDVYLFDEVMSVGDAGFRLKSKEMISKLKDQKKTVIVVSHQLNEIEDSDKFIQIEKGVLKTFGSRSAILESYIESKLKDNNITIYTENTSLNHFENWNKFNDIALKSIKIYNKNPLLNKLQTNSPICIEFEYEKLSDDQTIDVILLLKDANGSSVLSSSPIVTGIFSDEFKSKVYKLKCELPAFLLYNNIYSITLRFMKNLEENLLIKSNVEGNKMSEKNVSSNIRAFNSILYFKPIFQFENSKIQFENLDFNQKVFIGNNWTKL